MKGNANQETSKGERVKVTEDKKTLPSSEKHRDPLVSSSSSSSSSKSDQEDPNSIPAWLKPIYSWLAANFEWVSQNWTWSKIKPAFRCAVVAWISAVLFIVPPVQAVLGQASFLILIASFLSPPSDPFLSVLEREALILIFLVISWAWVCLGIFLSSLARQVRDPDATIFQAATGQYIEPAPTAILAIFIFFGSSFFLYIKVREGPGPYLFASVFGCICIDISLTTAVLFPYPFYMVGRSIILPMALHSGLALFGSLAIFPSTISALFTTRISEVLGPLLTTLTLHERLLAIPLMSAEFGETLDKLRSETKKSETTLVPLAAAARLLKTDLIYSRFAPTDFKAFQETCRKLAARADGLGMYFGLVDPNREKFPGTGTAGQSAAVTPLATPTVPETPRGVSRTNSRESSPERSGVPPSKSEDSVMTSETPIEPFSTPATRHTASNSTPPSSPSTLRTPGRRSISTQLHNPPPSHSRSASHHFSPLHLFTPSNSTSHPSPSNERHHHHRTHHSHSHHDLLHLSLSKVRARRQEHAVGIFETQRYLNLEFTKLHDPNEEVYTTKSIELLRECCTPLLNASHLGLMTVSNWLTGVRSGRFGQLRDSFLSTILGPKLGSWAKAREEKRRKAHDDHLRELKKVRDEVERAWKVFRNETRHLVLEPYRPAFEGVTPSQSTTPTVDTSGLNFSEEESHLPFDTNTHRVENMNDLRKAPPHRYLFNCYVYQYHLTHMAGDIVEMLDEVLKLEEEREYPRCRLWTPVEHAFGRNRGLVADQDQENDDDDDPDIIQGLQHGHPPSSSSSKTQLGSPGDPHPTTEKDLGIPKRRDPDALPPRNALEWVSNVIYRFIVGLGGGNSMFALKAGLLTVVLCLPSLLKGSARFAYENRFVWAIFMGQLTLARFRGDTTFGLTARIISTLGGGVMGMIMWYISAGSGTGNAYGLAAVCAVCFPFFFFARLYWPIPPMTNIIFFVTTILVIGYSYQDSLITLPGSPGAGWSVAWRRFVLVSAGVAAAFIVSLLPPSTTIRGYQRTLLSTTSNELGSVYCNILSVANTPNKHESEIQEILSSLIAVRNKLKKSTVLRTNVGYEFSFRGRWPLDRYQKIADIQMAIAYSLSHLISVLKHLESSWAQAFLRRTRFMDPDFQADLLAVVSMVTSSLRTGCPLPQITPCPLIDRFMLRYHGLNVIHKESEEDFGLPRALTLETLRDEQYLMFCVGIATAYGIVNRLDRLMIAVKEVVGEQYHIHGVGALPTHQSHMHLTPVMSMNVLSETLNPRGTV